MPDPIQPAIKVHVTNFDELQKYFPTPPPTTPGNTPRVVGILKEFDQNGPGIGEGWQDYHAYAVPADVAFTEVFVEWLPHLGNPNPAAGGNYSTQGYVLQIGKYHHYCGGAKPSILPGDVPVPADVRSGREILELGIRLLLTREERIDYKLQGVGLQRFCMRLIEHRG